MRPSSRTLLAIACLAAAGCGGPSVRYLQTQLDYEQRPLARPAGATTYAVEVPADAGFTADSLRIDGMTRAADKPDLTIRVIASPAQVPEPTLSTTAPHIGYRPVYDANGKEMDLTKIGRASCRERV